MVRNSFRDRREGYTDKAVVIRCVREDQSAVSIKLYYLTNGSARLGFWIQGREYLLPVGVVLKALADTTDHEIYVSLTCCFNEKYERGRGCVGTQLVGERVKIILDEVRDLSLFSRSQCLEHLGEYFQPVMDGLEKESFLVVADAVLRDYIFVHLDNNQDKFNLLIFMLQKLFSLIDHTSVPDNPDSLQNQEVLLPGHLITIYLKEKLQDWLQRARRLLQDEIDNKSKSFDFSSLAHVKKVMDRNPSRQIISSAIENMLKTGRLVTQSGLDLQQRAGMTVQAERLNFLRFLSHFRAVHRGTSFAGLRTTTVRKLLPESWGFLCPVHTPDGEPCGLLNHMACTCLSYAVRLIGNPLKSQISMRGVTEARASLRLAPQGAEARARRLDVAPVRPVEPRRRLIEPRQRLIRPVEHRQKLIELRQRLIGPVEPRRRLIKPVEPRRASKEDWGTLPSCLGRVSVALLPQKRRFANLRKKRHLLSRFLQLRVRASRSLCDSHICLSSKLRFDRRQRRVTSYYDAQGNVRDFFKMRMSVLSVLVGVGMTPSLPKLVPAGPPEVLSVVLDGRVVGSIPSDIVEKAVSHLRRLKLSATSVVPDDLEVGYVPLSMGGAYPGLYLFTSPSRFVRPVYMEIRCADGGDGGRGSSLPATHEEIHPTGILSVVANLTPWSDHNQSPRNMYQCQMAKQTMAFSSQALHCRADQKLYHLQTPQTPIVRTKAYEKYGMDEFPSGTNAIVAVLAYSGYDMEDAMVLNKSSVDRGLCRGHIYQTETIDLAEQSGKGDRSHKVFRRSNLDKSVHSLIDSDGLPYVGQTINPDDPYCSIYDEVTGATKTTRLKGSEPVIVDYVAVDVKSKKQLQKANVRFRRTRNPVIGDKFSSRHGQKGVCSQLWSDIDMPFSGVTGMRPDLIINPHAFPSRMTIAMLLESIAAKMRTLTLFPQTIFQMYSVVVSGTQHLSMGPRAPQSPEFESSWKVQEAEDFEGHSAVPTAGPKMHVDWRQVADRLGQNEMHAPVHLNAKENSCTDLKPPSIGHTLIAQLFILEVILSMRGEQSATISLVDIRGRPRYLTGRGGCLTHQLLDATPFSSVHDDCRESESESKSLVDELGSMLASCGFNYHGSEVLYSGVYGTELTCEIFMGPVYYQRLRHMVSDKYQVRSTGTVDQLTRQPIKGRKRGGGIRFGEMERDSLLAHGAAYLLHDRLHTCSDHHIADVCSLCGSILTTSIIHPQKRAVREIGGLPPGRAPKKVICIACQTSKGMETVAMPYVFRYLATELAAMNIKMTLQLSNGAGA
ncbi:nuclear RNA polymerase A2 [Actinidia rufa]|uniref:DNA-directed RNA polymerase subunit beta n=1 Tax=Actinidia rufa TaxID=165716 RepID=A0A7J0FUT9_9ERIC|nr:nuclear RNA polymerase A2 [Actinidia rufa]